MVLPSSYPEEQDWFVAVGASGSDGFLSIGRLLRGLPVLPNATVLITLHRPSTQLSNLSKLLGPGASMPVVTAVDLTQFERGSCYVREPARHLTLPPYNSAKLVPDSYADQHRNRTVDLLLTSVAQHAQANAIGVILPGALAM